MASIIERLQASALRSTLTHQHAAALMSHGRVLALSFNSLRGVTPGHAEISAIRKYLINRGQYHAAKNVNGVTSSKFDKKIMRLFSNTYMIVIRIGGHNHSELIESKPCAQCVCTMRALNIKRVLYSKKNLLHNERITDINTTHTSQMYRVRNV